MNLKAKEEIKEKVVNVSCGLLAGTADLLLFCIFQGLNAGKHGYGSIAMHKAIEDSVEEVVSLGIDKEAVKRAIWKATHSYLLKFCPMIGWEIKHIGF